MSENNKDTILYNGEELEIKSGLTEADIRESMSQVFASAGNAIITFVDNDDGTKTWTVVENGGDKG